MDIKKSTTYKIEDLNEDELMAILTAISTHLRVTSPIKEDDYYCICQELHEKLYHCASVDKLKVKW